MYLKIFENNPIYTHVTFKILTVDQARSFYYGFTDSILFYHLGALIFPGYKEHVCEGATYVLKLMLVNRHQVKGKKCSRRTFYVFPFPLSF